MLSALLFVIWVLGLTAFGVILATHIITSRHVIALVGCGIIVGLTVFVFVSNILARILMPPVAFAMTWAVLVGSAIVLRTRRPRPIWNDLALFGGIAAAVLVLQALLVVPSLYHDYHCHYAITTFLQFRHFPLVDPFLPDYALQYHYGIDILVAALSRFSGIGYRAVDLIGLVCMIGSIGVAFMYGDELAGKLGAVAGMVLCFFGGGMLWLKLFGENAPPDVWDKIVTLKPFEGFIHGNSTQAAAFGMLRPPVALGYPLWMLCMRACAFMPRPTPWQAGIFTVMLATLGIVEESAFAAALAAAVVTAAWGTRSRKDAYAFAVIVVAALIVLVQGGVMGNLLSPHPPRPVVATIELRWPPVVLGFVNPRYLPLALSSVPYVVQEFGWFLPLYFVIGVWAFRNRTSRSLWLAAGAALCAPVFFRYASHDPELVRFFGYFMVAAALLSGVALAAWIRSSKGLRRTALASFLGLTMATSLWAAGLTYAAYYRESKLVPAPDPLTDLEHAMGEWMRANVDPGARVITAGASWRFIAATGFESPFPWWPHTPEVIHRAHKLDEAAMRDMHVTHLYVGPDGTYANDLVGRWTCSGRLTELHKEANAAESHILYAIHWDAPSSCAPSVEQK